MQTARDEMKSRIKTLKRHAERCESERDQLLAQVAECNRQIEQDEALAADYEGALRRLSVSVSYVSSDGS